MNNMKLYLFYHFDNRSFIMCRFLSLSLSLSLSLVKLSILGRFDKRFFFYEVIIDAPLMFGSVVYGRFDASEFSEDGY